MKDFKINPIEQNGQRVLTTAQLAEAYGTDVKVISHNFNRNKSHYIEGKHFYCLTGKELKKFKSIRQFGEQFKQASKVYLWTERGALLHAKSLNTDKAWEVYEFLVDTYFRVQEISNSYAELVKLLRNDLSSDMERVVNTAIDKALNKRFKAFDKSLDKKAEKIIVKSVSETSNSLVPYFDTLIKIVQGLLKF